MLRPHWGRGGVGALCNVPCTGTGHTDTSPVTPRSSPGQGPRCTDCMPTGCMPLSVQVNLKNIGENENKAAAEKCCSVFCVRPSLHGRVLHVLYKHDIVPEHYLKAQYYLIFML